MKTEDQLIGYQGILNQNGIFVESNGAYAYAMEQIGNDPGLEQEYRQAITEWFFSGDYIKVYKEDQ